MKGKQLKQCICVSKSVDVANRTIEMVGSTEDYDRSGDKMFMSGADLKNFLKNPIILPNHDYTATAIGKCLDVHVEGTKLIFKVQFAETDAGNEWFYLYSNGYMNASSIGFIPLEYTPNDQGGYDFTKWELLELSLVTVPCNQNAIQRMAKAFKDGEISEQMYKHLSKMGNFAIKKENDKEDTIDMKIEEVQKLIDESVKNAVKSLAEQHKGEMDEKDATIAKLNDDLANVTKSLEDMQVKAGSAHSKATVDTVNECCKGISEHVEKLKALVCKPDDAAVEDDDKSKDGKKSLGAADPVEDDAKEYSDEEIAKMVEASVEKILSEAVKA